MEPSQATALGAELVGEALATTRTLSPPTDRRAVVARETCALLHHYVERRLTETLAPDARAATLAALREGILAAWPSTEGGGADALAATLEERSAPYATADLIFDADVMRPWSLLWIASERIVGIVQRTRDLNVIGRYVVRLRAACLALSARFEAEPPAGADPATAPALEGDEGGWNVTQAKWQRPPGCIPVLAALGTLIAAATAASAHP